MKITDIFQTQERTFSFEFFPPKTENGYEILLRTIEALRSYRPDFVSVTYGAMGTTQDKTIAITAKIQNEIGITAMSHLTCVGSTEANINEILASLEKSNIKNIMALRGDPPEGQKEFIYTQGGFKNGTDLIRCIKENGRFAIGGAGYPEGHVEAASLESDLAYLKMKMDMGADFIVTQLFLDNRHYYKYRDMALKKGVTLRIIPGVMPVTNYDQITKFSTMCGCAIPSDLEARLRDVRDNKEEVAKVGIEHATNQCMDLLRNGAPGLHFYTLNKSTATQEIFNAVLTGGYGQGHRPG